MRPRGGAPWLALGLAAAAAAAPRLPLLEPKWPPPRPYDPERERDLERALDPLIASPKSLRELPVGAVRDVAQRFEWTPNRVLRAVGERRDPPQLATRGHPFGDLIPLPDAAGGTRRFRNPRTGDEVRQVGPRLAVGRDEVTVAGYRAFLDATGHPPPRRWVVQLGRPKFPVVLVTWDDARAYCRWARARLPTSAEWSRAAGVEDRAYPWGNARPTRRQLEPSPPSLEARLLEPGRVAPPGRSPIDLTRAGLRDMVWNVEEWCADGRGRWFRAVRGGSVADTPASLPDLRRVRWRRRDRGSPVRGLRIAHDAWPPPPR